VLGRGWAASLRRRQCAPFSRANPPNALALAEHKKKSLARAFTRGPSWDATQAGVPCSTAFSKAWPGALGAFGVRSRASRRPGKRMRKMAMLPPLYLRLGCAGVTGLPGSDPARNPSRKTVQGAPILLDVVCTLWCMFTVTCRCKRIPPTKRAFNGSQVNPSPLPGQSPGHSP